MRIRINPLDRLFSLLIRRRDHYTCQRCLKAYSENSQGLHCAHIFGRRSNSTRYDEANAVALCYGCHVYLDTHPLEKYDWYIRKFGQEAFDRIRIRSKMVVKLDRKILALVLQEKLKALEA